MPIEQAIFTSALTHRARGYQLVATSPGVRQEDAQQISAWGPSHGSLCGEAAAASFFPLPSGAACVAVSQSAGPEYSGRGGPRVYTQFLLASADLLAQFANNPLALLRAARANGVLQVRDPIPSTLETLEFSGRAEPVDEGLLAELADRLGPRRLAWLIHAAVAADSLIVAGAENPDWLVAGLLNCLPVECRPELSFTTGLFFSPRRPFRLHVLSADPAQRRQLQRHPGVTLVDLSQDPPPDFVASGWAAFWEHAVRLDRLACAAAELRVARPGLRMRELPLLAAELALAPSADSAALRQAAAADASGSIRRPHPPHKRLARIAAGQTDAPTTDAPPRKPAGPAAALTTASHELLEKLERLDDLVFDTINGRRAGMDELARLWPQVAAELPREVVQESREQYIRYAMDLWERNQPSELRDPQWAMAALDVLYVLFEA
jgi:hypothetical protein